MYRRSPVVRAQRLSEVRQFRLFGRPSTGRTGGFLSNDGGIPVAAMTGMSFHQPRAACGLAVLLLVFGGSLARAQDVRVAPRVVLRIDPSVFASALRPAQTPPPRWIDNGAAKLPRYPFMADPRRWPRLFANTTECTLSLNPVTRRHWWQG